MTVYRWKFFDPYDSNPATNTWTVPMNPNAMTSPHPARSITTNGTTAVDGQSLFFEGNAKPAEWTFSGTLLTHDHYEGLRSWVEDRKHRVYIYDHFNREIQCVLTAFTPTPKRSVAHYWRHEYEVRAYVTKVGPPTVGL